MFGDKVYHPLVTGGQHKKLNQENKVEYINLYLDWILNKSIEKQFKSFRRGFYKVVTGNMIKVSRLIIQLFTP